MIVAGVAAASTRPGLSFRKSREKGPKRQTHNLFCFLRCVVFDDDKPRRSRDSVKAINDKPRILLLFHIIINTGSSIVVAYTLTSTLHHTHLQEDG